MQDLLIPAWAHGSEWDFIENVRKFISVDGGRGDNIRPALYGSNYEAIVVNRLWDERPKENSLRVDPIPITYLSKTKDTNFYLLG